MTVPGNSTYFPAIEKLTLGFALAQESSAEEQGDADELKCPIASWSRSRRV